MAYSPIGLKRYFSGGPFPHENASDDRDDDPLAVRGLGLRLLDPLGLHSTGLIKSTTPEVDLVNHTWVREREVSLPY